MNESSSNKKSSSRRDFLRKSTVAALGASIASRIGNIPAVHAAGSDQIRVGLIGCGGRGSGAADQVLRAAPNVKLVAMVNNQYPYHPSLPVYASELDYAHELHLYPILTDLAVLPSLQQTE